MFAECLKMFRNVFWVFEDVHWEMFAGGLQTNVCRMFEGKLTITTTFISIVAPSY